MNSRFVKLPGDELEFSISTRGFTARHVLASLAPKSGTALFALASDLDELSAYQAALPIPTVDPKTRAIEGEAGGSFAAEAIAPHEFLGEL